MFGCLLWFVGESPVAQQVNQKMQNSETSIMEMGVKKAHPWDVRVKVLLQYDATRLVSHAFYSNSTVPRSLPTSPPLFSSLLPFQCLLFRPFHLHTPKHLFHTLVVGLVLLMLPFLLYCSQEPRVLP